MQPTCQYEIEMLKLKVTQLERKLDMLISQLNNNCNIQQEQHQIPYLIPRTQDPIPNLPYITS